MHSREQDDVWPATRVVHAHVLTDPATRWKSISPALIELKEKAKKLGLWNLFLSQKHYPKFGVPLSNLEVRNPARFVSLSRTDVATDCRCYSMP